jgi:hypothetical protein
MKQPFQKYLIIGSFTRVNIWFSKVPETVNIYQIDEFLSLKTAGENQ